MKRLYISPETTLVTIDSQPMMSTSNSVYADMGGTKIGYGGVDKGGKLDPSSRGLDDLWDDEEEEEDW